MATAIQMRYRLDFAVFSSEFVSGKSSPSYRVSFSFQPERSSAPQPGQAFARRGTVSPQTGQTSGGLNAGDIGGGHYRLWFPETIENGAAGPGILPVHPSLFAATHFDGTLSYMKLKTFPRYLWREWIRPLALPILLITAAKSALADINYVPSGSMKPTILEGDIVFVNKLAYDLKVPFTTHRLARWSDPTRGDIVVCFEPDTGTRLVKRVIGTPGDVLELRNDVLFLNGVRQTYSPLPENSPGVAALDTPERTASIFAREQFAGNPPRTHSMMVIPARPALRNFGPITVPAGDYFMMGDNRDNSRDSRYFGFVPRSEIVGQAKGVFVSADLAHWLRPRFDRFCTALD